MRCEKVEFWWEIASDRRLMTHNCKPVKQTSIFGRNNVPKKNPNVNNPPPKAIFP